ncbi:MAG: VanZ family protein [Planctomycetes bacterium]|nr:VanZ family protein [Planctomycetota bacterium]MCK5472473.1 VanZ family protein [Planctomycetota bacterium]
MALLRNKKLTITLLALYWPCLFILTHVPIPKCMLSNLDTSDKTLHFLAYFILAFLTWLAIGATGKISWRKKNIWWVFLAIIVYAVLDEWLQGLVGRNCDLMDFLADIAGAASCLILLSFFSVRAISIVVIAIIIFLFVSIYKPLLSM